MKTTFETNKRVVTIAVSTRKCWEGEYVITPSLIYTKIKPRKEDNDATVAEKSLELSWLRRYVEIEWTVTKKN